MRLVVKNNWVTILDADPIILETLAEELRYKTPQARMGAHDHRTGWDGWVNLLREDRKRKVWYFPTGLLGRAVKHAKRMGFEWSLDDQRNRPTLGQPVAKPIPLFDYQLAAADGCVKAGRGVVDASPRSGKTRTLVEVVRRISLPTLWVAPTDRIVKQTVATLQEFLGVETALHLVGGKNQKVAANTLVVVCTAATAAVLTQGFLETREVIVVDEWHHAAAKSYKSLFGMCGHIYFRFGMTGTHFRSGDDTMAMEMLLANVIYRIGSAELVQRGRIVPLDVVLMPTHFDQVRGVDRTDFINGFGKHGAFEHVQRNQLVAHTAAYLEHIGRKVLVLVRTKAQGKMIAAILKDLCKRKKSGAQFSPVEFVSTDTKRKTIDAIIHAYNETEEVRVMVGTSMIGEGTDLPTADAMVYAAAGHADVSLIQNAYRVCTAVEGKPKRSILVDFGDRHHSALLGQSQKRLQVYRKQPTFEVHLVESPRRFQEWLVKRHPKVCTDLGAVAS